MAEVHGKIGFVPLSNLVAAEQVEGMQAFVQERGKGDRSKVQYCIIDLWYNLSIFCFFKKRNRHAYTIGETQL